MHKRQRRQRIRGLMGRALAWIIRRLADSERARLDAYCAAIEAELAARPWGYGYGY